MNIPLDRRLKDLKETIFDRDLDSFLVLNKESSDTVNLYYLTGFECSLGALIVTEGRETFLTDSRYIEAAGEELNDRFEIREVGGEEKIRNFGKEVRRMNLEKIGIDTERISLKDYRTLQEVAGKGNFVELEGTIAELRETKDDSEIALQKKAAELTDDALEYLTEIIGVGDREEEIALEMEVFLRERGAEGMAFQPTVASGVKSSRPHAKAGSKELRSGELLLFDVGTDIQGYRSDMTRTVSLGAPTSKQEEIYRTVLEAQTKALKAAGPGEKACEIDEVAREVIEEAGYGDNFRHGLGHGVGLEVHERPTLSSKSEAVLKPGMVVTIEPGIYLPGWGGVRIEDMVTVTEDGCRSMSNFPKRDLKNIL